MKVSVNAPRLRYSTGIVEFSPPQIRFTRPGKLPPIELLKGRVAVLDLAFNGEDPEADVAWATSLGDQLAAWVDHHDQDCWGALEGDDRFVLIPREQAPACPPLGTADLVAQRGPVDVIVCHGDLDGVLSAAKWAILQMGGTVPDWLDPDSIAADTRSGAFTERGAFLDHALRAGNDATRRAIVRSVIAEGLGLPENPSHRRRLQRAAELHEVVLIRSREMAARDAVPLNDLEENAVFIPLRPHGGPVDLTELLITLQKEYDWVVIRAKGKGGVDKWVVGTNATKSGIDLRQEFSIQGFAPFRVHVTIEQLYSRLPSKHLAALMA